MSPIWPATEVTSEKLRRMDWIYIRLRDRGLSSYTSSKTSVVIPPASSTLQSASAKNAPSLVYPAASTRPAKFNERDNGYAYVTISVTLPYTTYTSTVLLGDAFPTTNDPAPTAYAVSQSSQTASVETPGLSTGTIVGLVVGLVLGFAALVAVLYVYWLRARQARSRRRRRRSRRGSSATAEGERGIAGPSDKTALLTETEAPPPPPPPPAEPAPPAE